MKFAICNETFGDWPLHKALTLAREVGYTGWEVAPFTLTDAVMNDGHDQRHQYRNTVEQAGLEVIGLHWLLAKTIGFHLTTQDQAIRDETAEYLRRLAKLCGDLGGNLMVLGSPQQRNFPADQSMDSAFDNAADVLSKVAPTLEKHSVRIAIEPLGRQEGNFLNTAASARQLIDMVDHQLVQLHLDVKAMSDEPTPITKIIRDNAKSLIHFHANDPNQRGPGMGEVDFAPIFQTLEDIDYDDWVSVEVFDYSPGVETLVRESMENMLACI